MKPLQGKIVSGIYYEEISQFVPYTKVVPMAFEFKLKSELWRSNPLPSTIGGTNPFQILPRLNCRSDVNYPVLSTADWYFACPIFYHLNQYLQILKSNYTDLFPLPPPPASMSMQRNGPSPLSPLGPQENQKFTNAKVNFDECASVLEKTWKGISLKDRDVGFAFYTSIVEKCSSLPIYTEEKIESNDDYTGFFDRMQNNFVNTFFLNSSDPGELLNNLLSLQGLQLQSIFAELNRIRDAISSCQNNLIPQAFLKYSKLEKALMQLRPMLLKIRYAMSSTSVAKLYNLPIADCIFGANNLIVQILLPVVKSETNFVLLKVNSPVFLYRNRLCKVHTEKLDVSESRRISDDEEPFRYYVYDKTSKLVVSTKCLPGENNLCSIPDQTNRPIINRCLTSIMNGSLNPEDIRFYCNLQCESKPLSDGFSKLLIPMIQRISSNKFVVAVNRITSLLIKCEGKPDEMVTPQEYGAVEISLACGCHLMWHAEKYEARVPCANHVVVRHVVPEQMLNRSAVTSRNKFYLISKLGERINSTLMGRIDTGDDDEGVVSEDELIIANLDGYSYESTTLHPNSEAAINSPEGQQIPIKMITEDYNNESLRHSLSLVNIKEDRSGGPNTFSVYSSTACYPGGSHTFLWVAVGVETALFIGIALYLYCKMYEMNKKWDLRDRTAVTYSSAAQLTHVYE